MDRLTSYKSECKREMICRYENCDTCEEYCPDMNEDNCLCLQEILEKLAECEDLEEQGRLLKLPCAVGDIAYRINKGKKQKLIAMRVQDVKIFQVGGILSVKIGCVEDVYGGECNYLAEEIGRKVFLTREEAEAALKELKMGCGTGKVRGIFCLNSECENYFEDNCMKIFEEGTVNISKEGKCEDFKEGEYAGYAEMGMEEYLQMDSK